MIDDYFNFYVISCLIHFMSSSESFAGKLFITGGTGSFGAAVLKSFYLQTFAIRIFSRDEKKQDDFRKVR